MDKWARAFYQPCLPLGKNGKRITGCKKHIQLSREAASEGMVLLKNAAKVLPFAKGTRLALFGKGSIDYVKGGGGSGDVTCAYVRSLQDGLICKAKEGKVQLLPSTEDFYRKYVFDEYAKGKMPGEISEPKIPPALLEEAKAWTDTAVISICRFSGEGRDRRGIPGDGDFYLTKEEQEMVDTVTTSFPKVVVVLNVGGMVDTSWFRNNKGIPSVLWPGRAEWKADWQRQIFCVATKTRQESLRIALPEALRIILLLRIFISQRNMRSMKRIFMWAIAILRPFREQRKK